MIYVLHCRLSYFRCASLLFHCDAHSVLLVINLNCKPIKEYIGSVFFFFFFGIHSFITSTKHLIILIRHITRLVFHVIFAVVAANWRSNIVMPFTYATYYVRKDTFCVKCLRAQSLPNRDFTIIFAHYLWLWPTYSLRSRNKTKSIQWFSPVLLIAFHTIIIINLNLPKAFPLFSILSVRAQRHRP